MAILKTSKSRWIAGTIALLVMTVGTLVGLPTGGKKQNLPINMSSMSAAQYFAPVTPEGLVPSNVLAALLIPQNSTRTGWHNYDQGNGPYDREISITVQANAGATKNFFTATLNNMAWKILSTQVVSNGTEILALHSGSDGYFWEIGVTITSRASNSTPSGSSATAGSNGYDQKQVELRLLQYQSA